MEDVTSMDLEAASRNEYKTTQVAKSTEPFVDIGNLLIEDLDPFDYDQYKKENNIYLKALCRDNVQYLFNKIWELPTQRVEDAIVVKLPESLTRIPREKPIPKMRDATRWERYATLKGIRKMKKSRMIWSDETQSWQPRFGYKRAKDDTKDWVVEIPDQKDPYTDYIGERIEKKKERVAKNELQRLKNIRNQQAKSEELPGLQPEQKSSEQLSRQLNRATDATASLGKFTQKFKDEKRPKNAGKKRKFLPNEATIGSEKEKQLGILQRLQSKQSTLDVEKAVSSFNRDQQHSSSGENASSEYGKKNSFSRAAIRKKSRARNTGPPYRKGSSFRGGKRPAKGKGKGRK